MKRFNKLFSFALIVAGLAMMSCEGPAGTPGKDGQDGINGTDGTAACNACHTGNQMMLAKVLQYNHSTHSTGENAAYCNRSGCTECHVSQGFLDKVKNGAAEASYSDPLQPNCYTCHEIHQTFTLDDWALTTTAAVDLNHGEGSYDKGNSNLCANCHQARTVSPMPEIGGADVTISNRFGTHHGPVANILASTGGYEVAGSKTYGTTGHYTMISDGCVTCHMSSPYGTQAGGHQMGMEYDSHGTMTLNLTGCTTCHSDATALKTALTARQDKTQALLDQLKAILVAEGVYNEGTGLANSGTYSADLAGAYLNFQTVLEDRSLGVHNPGYTEALLTNSIEKLTVK